MPFDIFFTGVAIKCQSMGRKRDFTERPKRGPGKKAKKQKPPEIPKQLIGKGRLMTKQSIVIKYMLASF